jgi:hypothetical protein
MKESEGYLYSPTSGGRCCVHFCLSTSQLSTFLLYGRCFLSDHSHPVASQNDLNFSSRRVAAQVAF